MRKIVTFIVIAVLLAVNFNLLKGSYESAQKLKEVSAQEDKVKALENKNLFLKDQLKETDSGFYIEQQARDKLGFSKTGETTVIVENQAISFVEDTQKVEKNKSNLEKWVELIKN